MVHIRTNFQPKLRLLEHSQSENNSQISKKRSRKSQHSRLGSHRPIHLHFTVFLDLFDILAGAV